MNASIAEIPKRGRSLCFSGSIGQERLWSSGCGAQAAVHTAHWRWGLANHFDPPSCSPFRFFHCHFECTFSHSSHLGYFAMAVASSHAFETRLPRDAALTSEAVCKDVDSPGRGDSVGMNFNRRWFDATHFLRT